MVMEHRSFRALRVLVCGAGVCVVAQSKAIDADDRPCIIVSASGMCEGGRVLHHLRATIGSDDPDDIVLEPVVDVDATLG